MSEKKTGVYLDEDGGIVVMLKAWLTFLNPMCVGNFIVN